MEVIKTDIEGVLILEPRIFKDARGYFFESFSSREFEEKVCKTTFVQDNESFSSYGVVRGLHFQKTYPQAKVVRVLDGEVFDVAVDLRLGSKTYGKWEGVLLSEENKKMFMIPRGFAHGFLVLSDEAIFVCLIKPQFEVGRSGLNKKGIVKDISLRKSAVEDVISFANAVLQ